MCAAGQLRIAACDQALTRAIGVRELEQLALIEQAQLHRALLKQRAAIGAPGINSRTTDRAVYETHRASAAANFWLSSLQVAVGGAKMMLPTIRKSGQGGYQSLDYELLLDSHNGFLQHAAA